MKAAHLTGQVRAAEAALVQEAPQDHWMRQAAHQVARAVRAQIRARGRRVYGARALVLAGAGDNGGDGLYAAALLVRRGVEVRAVVRQDAREQREGAPQAPAGSGWRGHPRALREAHRCGVRLHAELDAELLAWAASADVWIDALTGTGVGQGPGSALRGPARSWVEKLRPILPGPCVVAVDLPSGICPDFGEVHGPVLPADLTVTIGSLKPGLLLPPAAHLCGQVELVLPELFPAPAAPAVLRVQDCDVNAHWPTPSPQDHKYRRGVLGLLAGSRDYPGAAVLAATAAVEAGAGMLRLLPGTTEQAGPAQDGHAQPQPAQDGPEQNRPAQDVLAACPEAVPGDGQVQARVIGPGLSETELPAAHALIDAARADHLPLLIDATGLRAAGVTSSTLPPLTVLTPHAGELAQLLARLTESAPGRAEVEARPAHWSREAARLTGAVVLLKGPVTVVAPPHGALLTATGAPAWLATAGAGDVLSGLLGAALSARGEHLRQLCAHNPVAAQSELAKLAALAAHVHARAAAQANPGGPLRALAVARQLPATLAELLAAHPAPSPGGVPSRAAGGTSAMPTPPEHVAVWCAAPQNASRRGRGRMTP